MLSWCGSPPGSVPRLADVSAFGLAVPSKTALVTAVLSPAELPVFRSWRCHARRLKLPFAAVSGHVAAHAAVCQAIDSSREETSALVPGEAASGSRSRLWLLARLLEGWPRGWSALFVGIETVLLHPWPGRVILDSAGSDLVLLQAAASRSGSTRSRWQVGGPKQAKKKGQLQQHRRDQQLLPRQLTEQRPYCISGNLSSLHGLRSQAVAFSALWLQPSLAIQELLADAVALLQSKDLPPLLGTGAALEEAMALLHMIVHNLCPEEKHPIELRVVAQSVPGAMLDYGMQIFEPAAQSRAMRKAGHWASAEEHDFSEIVGSWDLVYSNGFRTTYNIFPSGEVYAKGTDGNSSSRVQVLEAGRFRFHIAGGLYRAGKWERLRLRGGPGRMELEHWSSGQGSRLLAVARGFRRSSPGRVSSNSNSGGASCGCPGNSFWCAARASCRPDGESCSLQATSPAPGFNERPVLLPPRRSLRRYGLRNSGKDSLEVELGPGGGLGSKLQMAVAKAASAMRSGRPFHFVGHLGRYSNNSACLQMLGEDVFRHSSWGCLFQYEMPFLRASTSGRRALRLWPPQRRLPQAPVLQAALWRPSPAIQRIFEELAQGIGFDAQKPLLAVHIRRGDKITNIYNKYHPAEAYVGEVLKVARSLGLCAIKDVGCQLFVASDDAEARIQVDAALKALNALDSDSQGAVQLEVIGVAGSETQRRSAVGVEMATAMPADEIALKMTAEVMFDIEMISRATVVVGTLASQITRLGCSVGTAYGTLRAAVALDFELLPDMKDLFKQWGIRVDDVKWQAPSYRVGR
ncbi:unnamed protein product [Polarella glacialis]|uniref:Uncharacterized protein n=1 Tax=Polarella glacialis TaxID=89957 RepID=A0A813HGT5_POLGL|nr:unnamed protein product [Polarella glacialis]